MEAARPGGKGPDRLRAAAAMVFVDDLASPRLSGPDAHHLGRVLRLRAGEAVAASDGAGGWRMCRYLGAGEVDVDGAVRRAAAPAPPITVGFVPTKGDRPEWAVQKLTEIGVDRIVVVSSARSVVRWDGDRGARHVERLGEVARQAAMQSRRPWLPSVSGVVGFGDCAGEGWSLAEPGGPPPSLERPAVLIGPEGGWSPEEAAALPPVGLGPTVLRAETAAVVAATLLAALRAGLARPA